MNEHGIRGFKVSLTALGILYVAMASSMLVRGHGVMREFGAPEELIASPIFADFFSFFYEMMATCGLSMILFGQVTRDRASQVLVAAVFCAISLRFMLRDLATSDSEFGNHLYKGDKTLVFVYIGLFYATVFAALALAGLRAGRRQQTERCDSA
jgi:hypothetical protein